MRLVSALVIGFAILELSAGRAQTGAPTDQCTGPSASDVGTCRPLGGSGDTVSIIIEKEIIWVPGPPIIIWKHPSAAGSSQADFKAVDNPAMQRAINDWSETSWSLYKKGKAEMADGNYIAAQTYFNAAMNKQPPANEIDDIRDALAAAKSRQRFDNARGSGGSDVTIRKFSKTEVRDITPADLPPQLFDARRTDLDSLRKEIAPLLLKRYQAEDAVKQLKNAGAAPTSRDILNAQADLKAASAAVSKKLADNKNLITRVQLDK